MLIQAIESWKASLHSPDQFVVVDSSPNAEEVREQILTQYPKMFGLKGSDYLVNSRRSLTVKRNIGLDHLWTDLVSFADDDTIVSPHYAGRIAEVFARDTDKLVGGVRGTNTTSWRDRYWPRYRNTVSWPLKRIITQIYPTREQAYPHDVDVPVRLIKELPLTRLYGLWGASMTYRSELAKRLRFDEAMRAYCYLEDFDFSFRAG